MSYKKLVIPIGSALAALIANVSEASKIPADSHKDSSKLQETKSRAGENSTDSVLRRLTYQIKEQVHAITLHKSSSGAKYAQHESHTSHRSHSDHLSHRSGP